MSWEKVRLGDIADFSNGINFDKSAYSQGVKLIGVSNFGNRHYPDYNSLQEVKSDIVRPADYLQDGDIIFVRSNGNKELVGRCMLIQNPPEPVTFSGFCIRARLRESNRFYPKFFAYHFKSSAFRRAMSGTAVGANIQNLSQARLCNYELSVPDYKEQVQIASVLSTYDDLIDNNQKQIKLLEESAQRLYNEWFVDLHFPGYENTPVVDGVPKGWQQGNLSDIAVFKRGKTITKAQIEEGSVPVVAGGLEPAYYHNCANTKAPVITVSGSGANAGYTRLYNIDVFASDCSFVDYNASPYIYFIYCFLKDNKEKLDALQKGSAQPHVYAKDINSLATVIPSQDKLDLFSNLSSSFFEKIKILQLQIELSIQTRDRLLPKLMSGEIEV